MAYSGFRPAQEVLLNGLEKIQYRGYDSMGLLVTEHKGFKRVRSVGDLQKLKKKLARIQKQPPPLNTVKNKTHTGKQRNMPYSVGMAHSRWATHGASLEKNAHPHKAGTFYIVHNGIIENAGELKTWLKGPFLSDTDSEVVAHCLWHAYQQHIQAKGIKDSAPSTSVNQDSEWEQVQKKSILKKAVFDTLCRIKGEYAIVLMSEEHPNEIWAFKKGPSLLIGMGEKEIFICSDAQGILSYTNKVLFLQDGEVAHIQYGKGSCLKDPESMSPCLTNNPSHLGLKTVDQKVLSDNKNQISIQLYSSKQKKITRPFVLLNQKVDQEGKRGWPCYMLKEIHEQPECVAKLIHTHTHSGSIQLNQTGFKKGATLGGFSSYTEEMKHKPSNKISMKSNQADFLDNIIQKGRLNIVACGSSYYGALYGKYVIEKFSRIAVEVDMASEFRYRSPVLSAQNPFLLISQSGETADTLAVLKMAKALSLPTIGLCNVLHSSLSRGTIETLYMQAGTEKAVASTKAFIASLTILFLLALSLGKKQGLLSREEEKKWIDSFFLLPSYMKQLLSMEKEYKEVAQLLRGLKNVIYIGRDIYYPLALEGALKIKELTYRHAEAYPAGEMKHGPLALVDENMAIVGLVPKSHIYKKTWANLEEARCRGGKLILIGTKGDSHLRSLSDCVLFLPSVNEYLSAILCALPLQLMAYWTALALGHNVDQPRNLAKSVTVE